MLKSQRRLLPVLISLALTSSALAAGSESRLAGTWRAQSAQRNGAPAPDLSGHSMILSGERTRPAWIVKRASTARCRKAPMGMTSFPSSTSKGPSTRNSTLAPPTLPPADPICRVD